MDPTRRNFRDEMKWRAQVEAARRALNDDGKFLDEHFFFFELTVPPSALTDGGSSSLSILFPLVIAPEVYQLSEPFTLNASPGVDGGLSIEENGIIVRHLHIAGHFGWKPRKLPGMDLGEVNLSVRHMDYDVRGRWSGEKLSGQRHFHFFEDRIVRRYGVLKRDPATARGTELRLHNPKDDEHWMVAPQNFSVRLGARQIPYRYELDALVYERASNDMLLTSASSDKTRKKLTANSRVTAKIAAKELIAQMQAAAAQASGWVRSKINSVMAVIKKVTDLARAALAFARSAANTISMPFKAVKSLLSEINGIIDQALNLPADVAFLVAAQWRAVRDQVIVLMALKDRFNEGWERLKDAGRSLRGVFSRSEYDMRKAALFPPRTREEIAAAALSPAPGDLAARGLRALPTETPEFAATRQYVVRAGDTLDGLAVRLMGDVRYASIIASLNDLEPPYFSTTPLPGVVTPGMSIVVPTMATGRDGATGAVAPTFPGRPIEERMLGTDIKVRWGSDGLYDFVLSGDRKDVAKVSGVPNLLQATVKRVRERRGSSQLFPNRGRHPSISVGSRAIERASAAIRVRDALLQDPRIASVVAVQTQPQSPDTIPVEAKVYLKGLSDSTTVQIPEQLV